MTITGRSTIATGALALALLLGQASALAQSVDGYRLPGATVRPAAPGAQGPVDRDAPLVTTATPRPTPTPTPTSNPAPSQPAATASPQPSPQPSTSTRPAAGTPRQAPAPAASPSPPNSAPVLPQAVPLPMPGSTGPLPATPALPSALPTAAVPATAPAAASAATTSGWYWPWLAGAATLLALLFAGLWWRKRRAEAPLAITFEPPVVPARQPEPIPATEPPTAAAAGARDPLPQPQLSIAPAGAGLTIELESRRMNASLLATTLSYVLRITNHGDRPLSGLAIAGDMIAAHASLPPEAQIASEHQPLEHRHALAALAPGESAEVTGDFRLPLTAINPIRAGNAAYFVPLARLRVEAAQEGAGPLVRVQTWVVGELPEAEGAALKPFRLDLGPRTYSRLGQRAVN